MPFSIVRNDITKVAADAIVNTANPRPVVGGGTDTAIYTAAGMEEMLAERRAIGEIPRGGAAATGAFALPARYVIHTVGPQWIDGTHGEEETLASCYRESLALAESLACESIAFPLISAGVYGFPKDRALAVAIAEISHFLLTHEMSIILVVFDSKAFELSGKVFRDVDAFIDDHYVNARHEEEYAWRPERPNGYGEWRDRRPAFGRPPAGASAPTGAMPLAGAGAPAGANAPTGAGAPAGVKVPAGAGAPAGANGPTGAGAAAGVKVPAGAGAPAGAKVPAGASAPAGAGASTGAKASAGAGPFAGGQRPHAVKASAAEPAAGSADLPREERRKEKKSDRVRGFREAVSSVMSYIKKTDEAGDELEEESAVFESKLEEESMASFSKMEEESMDSFSRPEKEVFASAAEAEFGMPDLEAILREEEDTFQERLLKLIDEREMTDVEVYKRANLDRKLFSKIRCNVDYQPKKKTAVALAIALKLDLDETRDLLARAEMALSPSKEFDLIITWFIVHHRYNIYDINLALFKHRQPLLGA